MNLWPYLLLPVPIVYFWWRNRRWVPGTTRRSLVVRNFEAALCIVVLLLMGVVWLYDGTPRIEAPGKFGEGVSDTIRGYNLQTARWAAIVGIVAVLISWRVSTTIAVALVMLTGISGVIAVQQRVFYHQNTDHYTKFEKTQHLPTAVSDSGRLRFELIDKIAGADLWVNGVLLGKTPYETTKTALLAKVPHWEHADIRSPQYPRGTVNSDIATEEVGRNDWGEFSLSLPESTGETKRFYYKVKLNSTVGISHYVVEKSDGKHETSGSDNVITLDTVFPAWQAEIESLLDRARLDDYQVDEAWLAAFESYGTFATRRLEGDMLVEPFLQEIRDARVRFAKRLHDATNAATAWEHLMRIEDEARSLRQYDSGSDSGIAVDLLVKMLDHEQLVDHAIHLLKTATRIDPGNFNINNGRFATNDDPGANGDEIALWPIAQAIWRLDQLLDAEGDRQESSVNWNPAFIFPDQLSTAIHPELDNIIEQRITPLLIKLSYGNEHRLDFAGLLGGSAYESFLLRNDWNSPGGDGSVIDHHAAMSGISVNRWFYKLMWLRSLLGQAFRYQQSREILRIYSSGLNDFGLRFSKIPDEYKILFLDQESSNFRPSTAMKFWQYLNAHLTESRMPTSMLPQTGVLELKWDYLGSLWPESNAQMFLTAFHESSGPPEFLYVPNLPATLDAEAQYQILKTIFSAETKRIEALPEDAQNLRRPKYFGQLMLSELQHRLLWLPCESASRQFLQDLNANPRHEEWSRLRNFLSTNRQNEDLLRLMAESDDSKLQLLTLPAIERHPIRNRVELLNGLMSAEASAVRETAIAVKQRLDELQQRQFTPRASL